MKSKQSPLHFLKKPIVLVGLMGCGKSTVGVRLAQKLGLSFIDLDREIESQQHMTISEIFEDHGEEYFRKLEKESLQINIARGIDVIATGGGAFINEENRNIIKSNSISVWIRADVDTLCERVSRRNNRPILEDVDKKAILNKLIEKRYPIYKQADITVDTADDDHEFMVDIIISRLESFLS